MKGVLTKYIEDKGFGFIRGEDGNDYFLHISEVQDQGKFLENVWEYMCPTLQAPCYAVLFQPSSNHKGIAAKRVLLTQEMVNDPNDTAPYPVIITEVSYSKETLTRVMHGVKKDAGPPPFATAGGNGTYRLGYPEVYRFLVITFRRIGALGWGRLECHRQALEVNQRQKFTDSFTASLKQHLVGREVHVFSDGKEWQLADPGSLRI